jgi:DNA-binding transcriptional regulator YiaG
MPDIVTAIKDVVRRLARKEIKSQVSLTRKAVSQHRREIAELKRVIRQQQKKLASLESNGRAGGGSVPVRTTLGPLPSSSRYSIRSVKSQRRRLKLSAEEFGRLLGVTAQTVYNWEQGKARPRKSQLPQLMGVRQMGRREALQRLDGQGV